LAAQRLKRLNFVSQTHKIDQRRRAPAKAAAQSEDKSIHVLDANA
jgi:hypothetical protein